jgi:CcmD family protein
VSGPEKYVFAAYTVVLVVLLAYVVIMALKLTRLDRQTRELESRRDRK